MIAALTPSVVGVPHLGELLDAALLLHQREVLLEEHTRKQVARQLRGQEVRRLARRLALRLQRAGVAPGDRVALVLSNQPAWLITATGAFLAGAVVVPIDYKLSPAEQLVLLGHARPKVVVTEEAQAGAWADAPAGQPWKVWWVGASADRLPAGVEAWEDLPEGEPTPVSRGPEDLATLVYSSGTGGEPKGCLLPHRCYLSQLEALLERFPLRPGHRYFSLLPTNHAIDFMVGFLGPFHCGATVVHQRSLRPEFVRWSFREGRITHAAVVPLLLQNLRRSIEEQLEEQPAWRQEVAEWAGRLNERLTWRSPRPEISRRLLAPLHRAFGGQLELLFAGGAWVDPELVSTFYRWGIPVVIGYGLTEATTVLTVGDTRPWRPDGVGTPVRGVTLRIADPDPEGVGEVQVRGPTVMQGYDGDPEATEAVFDGPWLRTGDLGRFDASGTLHLLGRRKDVIVTEGGKNVFPQDVEGAFRPLVDQGRADEVVVFAREYLWPRRGMAGESLVLVVRGSLDAAGWRALRQLNRGLADYKRVRWVATTEADFPRTASMKLKRAALAAALRETLLPEHLTDLEGR